MKKVAFYILLIIAGFITGVIVSNRHTSEHENVEFTKHDTIYVNVEKPTNVIDTLFRDSIIFIEQFVVDDVKTSQTAPKIDTLSSYVLTVHDWNRLRTYSDTIVHSDTTGSVLYKADVRFNKLQKISFEFVPVTKVITRTRTRDANRIVLSSGIYTTGNYTAGIGLKKGSKTIGVDYISNFKNNMRGVGLRFSLDL